MLRRFAVPALVALFVSGAFAASPAKPAFETTPLMREESKQLVSWLEDIHYLSSAISEELYRKLITGFMAELDDQNLRMTFLASDEQEFLTRFVPILNEQLRKTGSLQAAFDIFARYREREEARIAWVLTELEKDIDFTVEETFAPDRREQPWPATMAEADDLWRRRIKYELIPEMLNGKTVAEARTTVRKRYERFLKNDREIEAGEVQERFLSTLTRLYDPHSTFFSADTFEDFSIQMRLSLVGIGALLSSEDGYCVIKELIAGGPAMLSKQLNVNDKIVAVAQGEKEPVDVIGMNLRKIVTMIRGQKNTPITLTIVPGDAADDSVRRQVTLVRDVVQLNAQRARASIQQVPAADGTTLSVGVLDLPSFYGPVDDSDVNGPTTSADVEELLEKLKAAKVQGIVLDLRRNGGGLLSEAVRLTGLFIPRGPVVQVQDSLSHVSWKSDPDNGQVAYDGPLVVLTSRYSASASEIVAGALQNYGRAIIVGDKSTHGKGTVQAVLEMRPFLAGRFAGSSRAGAAKLTTQKFYLPNGASTQNKGVVPDVSLPAIEDFLPIGEADLPNALPWNTIDGMAINGREIDAGLRTLLKAETEERIAHLEEFQFLKKRIAWQRERAEMKGISVNLETRRAMKAQDETFREEMKAEQTKLAELNFPSKDVLLDSMAAEPEPATETAATETDPNAAAEADAPPFDVHLREALRIISDAITVAPDPHDWIDSTKSYAATLPRKTADQVKRN